MKFVEGDVIILRDGEFVGVSPEEAERLKASRTPEQAALQDRLLAHFAGEAAELRAAHDALPDDVRQLVNVAVEEFARHPYTGPLPEEHVCEFGEVVGDDVRRCVLRWSDDTRCNALVHGQQRVYVKNRYLAGPPETAA